MNLQSAASIKAFTDYIQNCKNFPKRVVEKIVADIKKNVEKIVAVMVEWMSLFGNNVSDTLQLAGALCM